MNERIRELAEQAGFTTDEANITVGNYKDGNEYFYAEDFIEDELKKFAELIVTNVLDEVAERAYNSGDRAWSDELDRPWIELIFGFGKLAESDNETKP